MLYCYKCNSLLLCVPDSETLLMISSDAIQCIALCFIYHAIIADWIVAGCKLDSEKDTNSNPLQTTQKYGTCYGFAFCRWLKSEIKHWPCSTSIVLHFHKNMDTTSFTLVILDLMAILGDVEYILKRVHKNKALDFKRSRLLT